MSTRSQWPSGFVLTCVLHVAGAGQGGAAIGGKPRQPETGVLRTKPAATAPGSNRDAEARLQRLVEAAWRPPKKRKPTRPSLAAKRRRLEAKRRRGLAKQGRQSVGQDD
jgi:ribosome-associated protein